MYRKCKNIYNAEVHFFDTNIELNQSFLIDGYEAYLEEANQLYAQYRNELERVMTYFGCDKENELFVGEILWCGVTLYVFDELCG